jgi:hypothetical protein
MDQSMIGQFMELSNMKTVLLVISARTRRNGSNLLNMFASRALVLES